MTNIWDYPIATDLDNYQFIGSNNEQAEQVTMAQLDSRFGGGGGGAALLKANNLSDLISVPTARTNLGLGSAALLASTALLLVVNNLSDLASATTARTNLGLGSLAVLSTVNNSNWSGTALAVTNGGTGATDAATARGNLGLGTLSTLNSINNSNWSGTALAVANGGTGATDATTARTNLAVTNIAAQYVLATSDATMANAKILTAASGISITSGATIGIASASVTNAMLATMVQSTFKGRAAGAGTGAPVDLTATQATAILDAFTGDSGSGGVKGSVPAPSAGDAAAGKVLGAAGGWVAQSGSGGAPTDGTYLTLSLNATLSAERVFTLSGELTGTDGGVNAPYTVSITTNGVTLGMMAQVATVRFLGRTTAGTGNVEALTATQATALLNVMVGDSGSGGTKGLVPAPGAGDAAAGKFLDAAGNYSVPAGGSIGLATTNAWTGVNSFTINDAVTTSVTTTLTLAHSTSGTAAAGMGAGLAYNLENASGTTTAAMSLNAVFSTATGGAENVDFSVALKAAGVAPAEKFKVTSGGIAIAGGTNLLKESRTIAVSGGVTIDGSTSTLDLSANRTIGYSALLLSTITPDPGADWVPFWDTSGAVMGKALMQDISCLESWIYAIGAENSGGSATQVTTVTFYAPYAFQVTQVILSAKFHSVSSTLSCDLKKGITSATTTTLTGGTSIFITQPMLLTTTQNSEASIPASLAAGVGSQFTFNQFIGIALSYGTGATTGSNGGVKLTIKGYRLP